MKGDFVDLGAGALSETGPHDEFLELCALSASGDLTHEEQKKLTRHLAICPSCREALQQYQAVVEQAIPSFAADERLEGLDPGPGWSLKRAEKRFFDHLEIVSSAEPVPATKEQGSEASGFGRHSIPFPGESAWNHLWMLYAAGILLFASLGLFAYRIGFHGGSDLAKTAPPPRNPATVYDQTTLEAQLSDASHERAVTHAQIVQRDKIIADLRRELARQSDDISLLRNAQEQLQAKLLNDDQNKAELAKQQANLTQRLQTAEDSSHVLQAKLESLAQQSVQDAARAKASEARVNELTRLLQDRETEIEQQEQMLAHDRDIRELMGARDLYIAEVYDVGDHGETKKPYGRVFYTRGKSLIFYAYDLDQQSRLKQASTFQAWGRRGPDRKQAVNLGLFYEDNGKRWVMKCDDPRTLAQIDAVFVTVEPHGPSYRPSDNTLLFAYLKVNANHP
jgi:Putative zinc-finger